MEEGSKQQDTWGSMKSILHSLDKSELIDLIHAVYQSDLEIQQALTARFFPSLKGINRIRMRIMNLIYPNPMGTLPIRAGDALRTIRKFYRVSENPTATCAMLLDAIEAGTAQAYDLGVEDETYFNALGQMLRMLVRIQGEFPREGRRVTRNRLVRISKSGSGIGWGLDEELREALRTLREMCR